MLIHRIRLADVLSFGPGSQELKLEPLNVLIGPNGSGKSNLIEAIGLLKEAPRDLHAPIREGGGVHDWIWRVDGSGGIAQVEVALSYGNNRTLCYTLTFLEKGQRFRVNSEELRPEHPGSATSDPHFSTYGEMAHVDFVDLGSANEEVRMWAKDIRSDQSIFAQVRGPNFPELTYTAEHFERIRLFREWSFGRLTPARLPQKADLPNDFLAEDGANLGLVLNRLRREPESKTRLLKALRELYEGVEDFDVIIEGGTVQVFYRKATSRYPPRGCPMAPSATSALWPFSATRPRRRSSVSRSRNWVCTPTSFRVLRTCFARPRSGVSSSSPRIRTPSSMHSRTRRKAS